MFNKYHRLLMGVFFCLDIALTLLALALAGRWYGVSPDSYLAVALIWAVVFRAMPVYTSKRAAGLGVELRTVAEAVFVAWAALTACALLFDYASFPRELLLYFGALDLAILLLLHLGLRLILRWLRGLNYNLKHVLIVGAGPVGQKVAAALQERPYAGFAVFGYLDPDPMLQGCAVAGVPVLGGLAAARSIAQTMQVDDEVIITLPPGSYQEMVEVMRAIEDIPVYVRVVPDLYGVASIRPVIEDLWGIPMIGIRQPVVTGPAEVAKRAVDLAGSLLALVACAPLMGVIAVAIKVDSPGPVFYAQERVGENGRTFTMYKFRTMFAGSEALVDQVVDFERLDEPVFKVRDDPRVSRVGRWLRRTSLDELPQFVNVLRGEMSLVGPRPEETRLVQRYNSWHRKRLMMKPGITGPMQVGGRGDLPLHARVQLELDYINNYSLWRDLTILLKTIPAVIRGKGSY